MLASFSYLILHPPQKKHMTPWDFVILNSGTKAGSESTPPPPPPPTRAKGIWDFGIFELFLCERKRHTACQVASTPSSILSRGGGVPHPWPGGYLGPVTGVPPRKDMGPVEVLWEEMGSPWKRHGTSGSIMGWRWGNGVTPPPPDDG